MDSLQVLASACGFRGMKPVSGALVFVYDAISDTTTFRFFKGARRDAKGYGPVECEEFIDSCTCHGCWTQDFISASSKATMQEFSRFFDFASREFDQYVSEWKRKNKCA